MKNELQDLIHECTTELNEIEHRINELPSLDKMRLYLTNYALIKPKIRVMVTKQPPKVAD